MLAAFPSPDLWYYRWLAALVPLLFTVQFALIGLGIVKDEASVKAMSRTGDRREILRGPLFYGIIFVVMTLLFWKDSPIGMVAVMLMCGGDGLADITGARPALPKTAVEQGQVRGRLAGHAAGRLGFDGLHPVHICP